jgi:hypothetical protein
MKELLASQGSMRWRGDIAIEGIILCMKACSSQCPRTVNKPEAIFAFVLTFFLKGYRNELHFTLVLLTKQG